MEQLDSRLFPAFVSSCETLNFTRAAERLSTTQSNVSQQIQKLETQLGTVLFVRVNKKVSLTAAGRALLDYIDRNESALRDLKENIGLEKSDLSGWVRYGMPHSCLFTPHFEMLLKEQRAFPKVRLDVKLIPNEKIVEEILTQQLDFGFLTRQSLNPGIAHEAFAREEYVLVAKTGYWDQHEHELEEVSFIDHPGFAALFTIWRESIFPRKRKTTYESLKIVGRISSLSGAVTMMLNGVGASIVPKHVVETELEQKKLQIQPSTLAKSAISEIWISMLQDRRLPSRVRHVIESFRRMKKT